MSLSDVIESVLQKIQKSEPTEGTVYRIDGQFVDVKIRGSSTILRNVRVIGDADALIPGQSISLRWEYGVPVALMAASTGVTPIALTIAADGESIENSALGIRVRRGGIRPYHLAFEPSMAGHTHKDSLQMAGWEVDADGVIHKSSFFIHPDGLISMGNGADLIKLSAMDALYRLWIGNSVPADAPFKVGKDGALYSTLGRIGGWDIDEDSLSAAAGAEIRVGSGNDIAVLSADDPLYRFWIGNANPAVAPFRVTKSGLAYISASAIEGTLQSQNYVEGVNGWKIDSGGFAEFHNALIRGRLSSTVFAESAISVASGKLVLSDGSALISDVGSEDNFIVVDGSVLMLGDIVRIKPDASRDEWMRIASSYTQVDGNYKYYVVRGLNSDEQTYAGPYAFNAGETVVRYGSVEVSGENLPIAAGADGGEYGEYLPGGATHGTAGGLLVLEGSRQWGPYIGVVARYGPLYNQLVDVVRIGNLNGILSYMDSDWGAFFGDANNYLVYDQVGGLKVHTRSGSTRIDGDGMTTDLFTLLAASAPTYLNHAARLYYDEASPRRLRFRAKNGAIEEDRALMEVETYDGDADGTVDNADWAMEAEHATNSDFVPWTGVQSKPSTFPPDAHSHANSVHIDVSDEFTNVTEVVEPVGTETVLVENAAGDKRKIQVGNIGSGGGGGVLTLTNKSGAQRTAGEVVIFDKDNASAFKTTTVIGDRRAMGIVKETIANNASGEVATGVETVTVNVAGNVAIGDALITSSTVGRLKANGGARQPGFVGFAVTAYGGGGNGTVDAIINPEFYRAGASLTIISAQGGNVSAGGNLSISTNLGQSSNEKLVLAFFYSDNGAGVETFNGAAMTAILGTGAGVLQGYKTTTTATGTQSFLVTGLNANAGGITIVCEGHVSAAATGTANRATGTSASPSVACTDAQVGDVIITCLIAPAASDLSSWGANMTQVFPMTLENASIGAFGAARKDATIPTESVGATLASSKAWKMACVPVHLQ